MSKYRDVKALQLQTLNEMRKPFDFSAFLETASYLHRYSFPEQVLIFAQRPGVTAVAPMTVWNRSFGRKVKKGSKGIAVVSDDGLRYVFDVADTELYQPQLDGEFSLWQIPQGNQEHIFKALEQKFGECYVDYQNHAKFIWELVGKVAESKETQVATAIVVLNRLGYKRDFEWNISLESVEQVVEIGTQAAKYSRLILDEVRKQVKIFGGRDNMPYTKTKEVERYEHINLREARGLSNPEHRGERATGENLRQVGATAEGVSQSQPRGAIQSAENQAGIDTAPQPSGRIGKESLPVGDAEIQTTGKAGDDGLGAGAKPIQEPSRRSSDERTDNGITEKAEVVDDLPLFSYTKGEQIGFLDLASEEVQEQRVDFREDNRDLIGKVFEYENRTYKVDHISEFSGDCSLMDITFADNVGFPIFRSEPVDIVRGWVEEYSKKQEPEIITERQNFCITDDNLGVGGAKTKYKANIEAIKLLKTLEDENRLATSSEQEILSRYVGWGSMPQAFDETKSDWAAEYLELKNTLDEDEYRNARASVLNAHYTSPIVIKAIYQAISNMGFEKGNILEPACGIGNFLGLLPENMQNSHLYGVELDSITGRIATQLYQKAHIEVKGYEETTVPDSFFDVAIGNVPFGDFGVNDRKYNQYKFAIHDYFFAKSLDKVRSGGVVAFITSKGTMDKKNCEIRKYIAQRAELLGAIRLPNNAFKSNAGTEVTTDILFLQKRDSLTEEIPDWVYPSETDDGVPINSYFTENPEMVLGKMAFDNRMYGRNNETSCLPFEGADLAEQLQKAISNIKGEIKEAEFTEVDVEEVIPADPMVRNFSFTILNNEVYYRTNSTMELRDVSSTAQERIENLLEIRDCVRELIDMQVGDFADEQITAKQAELNRIYDNFTKKYGIINSRGNNMAFSDDSSYPLLCSLEVLDEDGRLERKADMFTKRTIKRHTPVTRVDTAVEALGVSLGEKGKVDLDFMSGILGKENDFIVSELQGVIFEVPQWSNAEGEMGQASRLWQTADEYLSGDVREKLTIAKSFAENDERFAINVDYLEKAIPKDIPATEIDVRLCTTWIPPSDYEQFMYDLLDTPFYLQDGITITYSDITGAWNVKNKSSDYQNIKANNTYGTRRINAYKIIEDTLNMRSCRIYDTVQDTDGEKRVLNKRETAIACEKQESIKEKFKQWIWNDPDRRERLWRYYNDHFNNINPREYDGNHITFQGMNPEIKLRTHQINAVARVIYGGNTLLAHCVGAGKTLEMVASAMESKRLGLCQKSMIVVPNHLTEQWASEFLWAYPSANILVTTKKDFQTQNRRKFCSRIATGDYDAVIIGHSQFEKIPVSQERMIEQLEGQINEIVEGIADLKRQNAERFQIKQAERIKKNLETKLQKLNDTSRKDNVVTFEELGVDRLFVDESDLYKNLYIQTKMQNVAGIGQSDALKASDMFAKCQYMDEETGGKGVIFATGTPISNTDSELYTVQRYLQHSSLQKSGFAHFDCWASTYGEARTAIELAPEGTGYRMKTRFSRFNNIPELMANFKEVADIQTAEMLDLPVPKANYHNISVPASDVQKDMVQELANRAEAVRGGIDPRIDNMLKVTNDGRKLALDQRMENPLLADEPFSKVNTCVNNVFDIWDKYRVERLTQLIFCDLSTPKNDGTFNVYDDIKAKLIEKGVPENEVEFIHNAKTDIAKKELFAKVRKGSIRVLIGSTSKMGAGTNCQDKLIALHDLDAPWRPRDLIQRSGRIIRQGNQNDEVHIFRYVTENTFDAYIFQLLENKQRFISQIMTNKSPARSIEDVDETVLSFAEVKALATGNPEIKEKMELDNDVAKLKMLKSSHTSQKYDLEDFILKRYPKEHAAKIERISAYRADIAEYTKRKLPDGEFVGLTIKEVFYKDKQEAGKALLEAVKGLPQKEVVQIGEYMSFSLSVEFSLFNKEFVATLKGETAHSFNLGADPLGNITRMNNALEKMAESLADHERSLEQLEKRYETAKVEVDVPFDKDTELETKLARLNELNALLNMDEKEPIICDDEPVREAKFTEIGDDER